MAWRSLRRLGAAMLTPGAAILPFTEGLQEQLDWLAQEIEDLGGDAWVLPVVGLSAREEARVIECMRQDRQAEYLELTADAQSFLKRAPDHPMPGTDGDHAARLRTENELLALQRRFRKIRARDHLDAPGRIEAAQTIDRCLAFRQGISSKLTPATDDHPDREGR